VERSGPLGLEERYARGPALRALRRPPAFAGLRIGLAALRERGKEMAVSEIL